MGRRLAALAFVGALALGAGSPSADVAAGSGRHGKFLEGALPAGLRGAFVARRQPYWAGKNGDALRTGASKFTAPWDLQAPPSWSWHEPGNHTFGLVHATPLIDGDKNIYVASNAGGIYKFSASGELLWSVQAPAKIPCVPALIDGRVVVTTEQGDAIAYDTAAGGEVWRTRVSKYIFPDTWSVTAAEGVVVVASNATKIREGGHLYVTALNAANGHELWRFRPEAPVFNFLAAVAAGRIYFADSLGTAYALRLHSGELLWMRASFVSGEMPVFSTGGAILGRIDTVVVTGNIWTWFNKSANTSELVPSNLTGTLTGRVRAIRAEDGELLWSTDLPYEANNAATVGHLTADGPLSVIVGIGENPDLPPKPPQQPRGVPKVGQVVALDAESGRLRWTHDMPTWHDFAEGDTWVDMHICLPDAFSNAAIGGDGTVYVGYQDGRLYALRETAGNGADVSVNVTSYDAKAAFQGSPAIAPGLLAATPCDGLHVWRSP